jgi:hypothetical protein
MERHGVQRALSQDAQKAYRETKMIIETHVSGDRIPTTEEDFYFYISEFKRYQEMWNLMDWEVNYQWEEMNDCRACIQINIEGKLATTCFNKFYDVMYDAGEVSKCAFHECMELFLGTLTCKAAMRFIRVDEIEEATHTCIRTMENLIWECEWQQNETAILAEREARENAEAKAKRAALKGSKKPSKKSKEKDVKENGMRKERQKRT